ncbi:hypothetical protein GCM10009837_07000 [Streptomyces durmitorensis]
MPTRWRSGLGPNGFLAPERTDLIDTALARGWPLDGMCPHPACILRGVACVDVTAEPPYVSEIVVYEFHPCGHRYWPQWSTLAWKVSPLLEQPVSRRRRRRWPSILRPRAVQP